MKPERLEFLQAVVLGTPEAKELFEFLRDEITSTPHRPSSEDPNNEGAKIAMAVAETYQYLININSNIREGNNGNIRTTGQPSIE